MISFPTVRSMPRYKVAMMPRKARAWTTYYIDRATGQFRLKKPYIVYSYRSN